MLIDLHNHTKLCNHASGEIDEYIQQAIKKGIKYFGFSDHAPMDFDPKYRMSFEQMSQYENAVLEAKDRYAKDIDILLAYEVDYLEGFMDERVLKSDVDYLIGSVHFLDGWGFDNPEFIGRYEQKNIDDIWVEYFNKIESMAKTNLFDIVGHIDLIKVFKFLPKNLSITEIAKDALKAIKDSEMSIEINMAGYRKPIGEAYPSREILLEAKKLGIEITFGSDAHKPEQVGLFNKEVVELAKDVGYTRCVYYKNRKKEYKNF